MRPRPSNRQCRLPRSQRAVDVAAAAIAVNELVAAGMRAAVNFPFASSFGVDQINSWMRDGRVGTPQRLDIAIQFAAWPRPWQLDAAGWLDARAEGGFTREVASHFLFLTRRQLGPLQLISADTAYPIGGKSERAMRAELTAGGIPVTLEGSVGTTQLDDHNSWTLTGDRGRIRLRDWSIAEAETNTTWQPPADAKSNEVMRPLVLARQLDKIAAMTRSEPTNLATLTEALEVQSVVEAILQSTSNRAA